MPPQRQTLISASRPEVLVAGSPWAPNPVSLHHHSQYLPLLTPAILSDPLQGMERTVLRMVSTGTTTTGTLLDLRHRARFP